MALYLLLAVAMPSYAQRDLGSYPPNAAPEAIPDATPVVPSPGTSVDNPGASNTGSPSAFQALSSSSGDLPNFVSVNDKVLRGGQPTEKGLSMLKDAGVKTVINLRTETNLIANEEKTAKKLGMHFVNLPMYMFEQPDSKKFKQFLSVVNNPANQPVYVHCRMGQDRTGTMIGAYRMTQDKWTATKAFDEMYSLGFRPGFVPLMKGFFEFARSLGDQSPMPSTSFVVGDLKTRFKNFKQEHIHRDDD